MTQRRYRIGEAAKLLGLEGYVLRFWETEFRQLRPVRTPKGQRLYTEKDVALLRTIRSLLYDQGMTIEGARRALAGEQHSSEALSGEVPTANAAELMGEVRTLRGCLQHVEEELLTLRRLLRQHNGL